MFKKIINSKNLLILTKNSRNFSIISKRISLEILKQNNQIKLTNNLLNIRLLSTSSFKINYDLHIQEREAQNIVPKPLDATQTNELINLLKNPPKNEENYLLNLLVNRIPPGVDEAAYVKASFLTAIAKNETTSPLITPEYATELLGTMQGGYNIHTLVELLDSEKLGPIAANGLSKTLLMFESFYDVEKKARNGNVNAQKVLQSWANAEWFTNRPEVPKKVTVTVFKVYFIIILSFSYFIIFLKLFILN